MRFSEDILPLQQHCITVVIALGLLEMVFWYFDYANFNSTGMSLVTCKLSHQSWVNLSVEAEARGLWHLLHGLLQSVLSERLCDGFSYSVFRWDSFGVVKSTLVLLDGVTYFVASEMLDIAENVGIIDDVSGRAKLFLVLPDAFLDAFLILWIFTSLSKTVEQLQTKRTSVKLDIYRKFSNALTVLVVTSVAWIVYEVHSSTDPFNERWQTAWTITAFWDVIACVLLCIICYLWTGPRRRTLKDMLIREKWMKKTR
ncbi:BnaC02g33530D [Brassica napus]|uniref:BnaC02g33530D protein n=1 Tax=Brassica napus TaxID=3708 RepID=A0A078HG49_BRANA|nr:BnaC02g33530D [Brassica napus]